MNQEIIALKDFIILSMDRISLELKSEEVSIEKIELEKSQYTELKNKVPTDVFNEHGQIFLEYEDMLSKAINKQKGKKEAFQLTKRLTEDLKTFQDSEECKTHEDLHKKCMSIMSEYHYEKSLFLSKNEFFNDYELWSVFENSMDSLIKSIEEKMNKKTGFFA